MRSLVVRRFLQNTAVLQRRHPSSVRCLSSDESSSESSSESSGGGLYSKDIAFKPSESGWGGGQKYHNNFDNIFGKKKSDQKSEGASSAEGESPTPTSTTD